MHDILLVLVHSIVTVVRLLRPGGLRAVVAESALTRHQLLILNRSRKRAPNLRVSDRIIAGLCTLLMHPSRMVRCGMFANCPANHVGLRHGHRQGCGPPDSWKTLRARVRIWRAVLADLSRSGEGPFVEHGPVSW